MGFGEDDWWGCVVTSLVPPTTPDGASGRRLWGVGLRGGGGRTHQPATHRVSRAQTKRMK